MRDKVAEANIAHQEELLKALRKAQEASGISLETVAARLAISPELAESALAGQEDLTLTELRYLALALEVVITYKVTPSS